jgi:two-component system sensor histidine kinase UhpB
MLGWRMPRIRRYSTRLTLAVVLPSLFAFVVSAIGLVLFNAYDVSHARAERGASIASSVAENTELAVVLGDSAVLRAKLREIVGLDPTVKAIAVCDRSGALLASTSEELRECASSPYWAPIRSVTPAFDSYSDANTIHAPVEAEARSTVREVGRVSVLLAPPTSARSTAYRLGGLILVMLFIGLGALAFGLRLRRPVVEALVDITACLERIGSGRYGLPQLSESARSDDRLRGAQRAVREAAQMLAHRERENAEQLGALRRAAAVDAEKRRQIGILNQILEEERRRLSSDIHDQVGATLATVAMLARRIGELTHDEGVAGDAQRLAQLNEASARLERVVGDAYEAARKIVKTLRPETLDILGLEEAVAELVDGYETSGAGCEFVFRCSGPLPALAPSAAITAYRTIQESLTNVVKHAQARHATVLLQPARQATALAIEVTDDGGGFDVEAAAAGETFGLVGMRERVLAAGGEIVVDSSPAGTRIRIVLPGRGSVAQAPSPAAGDEAVGGPPG